MDHIPSAVASGGQRRLLHCKVDSAATSPPRSTPAAPDLAAPQSPLLPISGCVLYLLDSAHAPDPAQVPTLRQQDGVTQVLPS